MKQTFTTEDLTAYLYSEMSVSRRLAFEKSLAADPLLANELAEMKKAKEQFPRVKFNAPKRSLQGILNYSRSTALEGQY